MIGHDPQRTYIAVVIGAGSGGLTVALGLAEFGHDVVLIEGGDIGGDCTNVGCIPSKALLHAARTGHANPLDLVRERRDRLAEREDHEIAEHPSVHLVRGWGRLTASVDPHVVTVDGPDGPVEVRAENVVVCGGSRPVELSIDGLHAHRTLTNENVFDLAEVPRSLMLVGGGAISLEMATAFCDLGTRVDIVELADRVMPAEDPMVATTITAALEARGVRIHTDTSIDRFDEQTATAHLSNGDAIADVDVVFVGVGRRPRLDRLGLEEAGIDTNRAGIVVDDWGRTSVDGIFAVGDITGTTLTTHGAHSVGRRVVRAIAFPKVPKTGTPRTIPTAVYSRPEIASVGLEPDEVAARPAYGRTRLEVRFADLDRGFTDDVDDGFAAVDVERFSGKILRAVIVGPTAPELIGMFTMMIDHGIGLRKMFGTVHPYPSHADAIGRLADDFALATYRHPIRAFAAMLRGRVAVRFGRS